MKLYFNEPRLNHTAAGAFFVRFAVYITYSLLFAVTVILLLNPEIPNMRWAGLILGIFLIDRTLHINEAEKSTEEIKRMGERGGANLAHALTPRSFKMLRTSFKQSLNLKKNFHLSTLELLIDRKGAREALKRLSVDAEAFLEKIKTYNEKEVRLTKKEAVQKVAELVRGGFFVANDTNDPFVHPRNLMVAVFQADDPEIKKLLGLFNITARDLKEAVIFDRYRAALARTRRVPATLGGFAHHNKRTRKRIMNRAWTARPTKFLDRFSTDLTALARQEKMGFLVGHKKAFEQMINALSRPDKPNALLVGEPGVGKTSIIAHLAFRIIKDEVPSVLFDKRMISLDVSAIIAGGDTGKIAERFKRITEEIVMAGNIVLYIPNIHDLFKQTGESDSAITPIDLFLPLVKNDSIPVIGETYPGEFRKHIQDRGDFMEQFENIRIEEMSEEETVRLLTYQSLIFENQFKMVITLKAIKKSVSLAYRYLHQKPLPLGAIDLLKQSLARAKHEGLDVLKESMVVETAEDMSRIPIQKAGDEEAEKLLDMEKTIHENFINQDAAVEAVSRHMREYRSGLENEDGPIASFLFVGPTGVGKTELSKQLARIQFGSEKLMRRFDMSEYQDKQSVFQLIGTPDGKKRGYLTDAILENPYSLVLLDELEKAHPDVLNIFLQVLDDGRLTDSLGRTVSFENTIIIATSNAHSELIKKEIESGKNMSEVAEEIKTKLSEFFKPELLNRFSDIIVFRGLKIEEVEQIAKIMIDKLINQVQKSQGVEMKVDENAVKKIAELGYSPVFGARPLKKTISKNIKGVLAEKILRKEIGKGNKIWVLYRNNRFEVKITE